MRGLQKRRKGLASSWKWTGKRLLGALGWYGTSAAFRFGSLYESLLVLRTREAER